MATITTRAGKGSPLTNTELDNNFTNLNTELGTLNNDLTSLDSSKVNATGDSITGNLGFGDGNKVMLGTGNDLQVLHNGANSYIDNHTGNLYINNYSDDRTIQLTGDDGTGAVAAYLLVDGANGTVNLNHYGSQKLITSSTGVDITGEVKADKFTNDEALPDVRPSLLLDFANSKTLDPRITFTRGSTATYWDGKTTTKAEENFLPYSQSMAGNWSSYLAVLTNNQASAPDGTTTAMDCVLNSGGYRGGPYRLSDTAVSGETYVYSIYAKAGSFDGLQIVAHGGDATGTTFAALFNLTSGTVHSYGSSVTPTITSVGNSWYRCSVVVIANDTTADIRFYIGDSASFGSNGEWSGGTTSDGTDNVYLWGAQREQRSSATAYTATTSQPIIKFQPVLQTAASGEARFDHDPVTGESKGLLIEEARTNLHLTSESAADGTGLNAMAVISNDAIAPDGAQTADFVYPTGGTGRHEIQPRWSATSGVTYAFSVYIKAVGTVTQVSFSQTGGSAVSALFDLINGTATNRGSQSGSSADIEDVGNGWYRCILIGAATSSNSAYSMYISPADENGTLPLSSNAVFGNFPANGANGILLWGAQAETGSFPTSYIPTSGSTVTRSNDKAEVTDLAWFTQGQGTVFTDIRTFATTGVVPAFAINEGAGTRTIDLRLVQAYAAAYDATLGGSQAQFYHTASDFLDGEYHKYALAYQRDNFARAYDGANLATDTSGNVPTNLTRLLIGGLDAATVYWLNGHVAKFAFYPQRLSNATLQAMTEE